MAGGRLWTEAEDLALVELAGTCTNRQLAAYVDRKEQTVNQRLVLLRKRGLLSSDRRSPNMSPFKMSTGCILLARTCLKCGKFKGAKHFSRRSGFYRPECNNCLGGKTNRAKVLQDMTVDQATKGGQPYTLRELEIISDIEKPAVSVALELNRTYMAIRSVRKVIGVTVKRKPVEYWLMNFPNAAKALQEHFIRLGVPDDQWDEVA